eukprot:750946-Hanusia_phi.AAC.3
MVGKRRARRRRRLSTAHTSRREEQGQGQQGEGIQQRSWRKEEEGKSAWSRRESRRWIIRRTRDLLALNEGGVAEQERGGE